MPGDFASGSKPAVLVANYGRAPSSTQEVETPRPLLPEGLGKVGLAERMELDLVGVTDPVSRDLSTAAPGPEDEIASGYGNESARHRIHEMRTGPVGHQRSPSEEGAWRPRA
jgi:hypothetical protein